jgi:hypothetical protein
MSRVHDAMRNLEHKSAPEKESSTAPAPNNLVAALIGELADEVPDDPNLETVRADLLSVSRSYQEDKKRDLALRFYLAMRSSLHAYGLLHERLRRAEKKNRATEFGNIENASPALLDTQASEPIADHDSDHSQGHHA